MTFDGNDLRRLVIEVSRIARTGHIGSALSVCDLLAVLFRDVLQRVETSDADRDRFILSKGHAALALYAALHRKGHLSRSELESYCADGSRLGVHPERGVPSVSFTTGSLGLGLSVGAGMSLARRASGGRDRVFVLLSDAECNEGSVWEAVMFAAHHRLSRLVAIVDDNSMQAMGRTRDVLDLSPLESRWAAFGWDVRAVDGHDEKAIREALEAPSTEGRPRAIIARTVSGKGVSFMESRLEWHYYPINDEQAARARRDLGGAP